MANASISQAATRVNVAAALQAARREAAEHKSWMNAINKAALNLEAVGFIFDGDVLQIGSATEQGKRYTVDAAGCTCLAGQSGKPCWHRAARRLLRKAAEVAAQPVAVTPVASRPADVQAAVDELFS